MKKAAVILIINLNGLILGVSRKNDKNKFGLPGGKLNYKETYLKAAIRETFEETGLNAKDCKYLLTKEDEGFKVKCFYTFSWEGEISSKEEGIVKWLKFEEIMTEASAFPEYNKKVFEEIKKIFPNYYFQ